ncbi:glycosyltransferase family 4 protein [Aurantiacibacter marinus]|uniref:Glycosyl transferase family 1 n=1 Tax=Aurantiacibacter marinus TaxID=874156 RepID=A0A0H0XP49_9SPHN|nr:glycosyltransferase family 4 protein [Aurantiacibacter marinus]KLI63732.1 hypothetical protein AAV99_08375 [Aurantiacibacter marinus]
MADKPARGSLIFVNRYFWPDRSATSQILTDVAFHLAQEGYGVKVIASRLSYESDEGRYAAAETHKGVAVERVATPSFGRGSIAGRVADYLGFYITAFFKTLATAKKGDVVIAKTDPPVLSWPIGLAARIKGARRANWLQDLYPEVAEAFGVLGSDAISTRMVRRLRDNSLRQADCNVAIGDRMADLLRQQGVADSRITVIPNMTDDEAIRPIAAEDNPLRKEWGFADSDLVVGYSGNLGRAHEVDTLLDAAQLLQAEGRSEIHFLVIGGGFLREKLESEITRRSLSNFRLEPYQPRDQLHFSLTVPDVHWVSLLPDLEGLIVPSKFYGAAASGRPVIFIGSHSGELGSIVPERNCGAVVDVGAFERLADLLRGYADNPANRLHQGRNARELVEGGFNRAAVFAKWETFAASFVGRS